MTSTHPSAARLPCALIGLGCLMNPHLAAAHIVGNGQFPDSLYSGGPEVLVPLLALTMLYLAGLLRLWRRAGIGHGILLSQGAAFVAAIIALVLATVWPMDALGEWSLAAHVGQHMLLLCVASPLLVLANLPGAMTHALPAAWTRSLARIMRALRPATSHLAAATTVHLLVMWAWHLPRLTEAALRNDYLHWAMHGSFLIAGLWFWAAVMRRHQDVTVGIGAALLALTMVMMHMGLIGALLCFSPRLLYPVYLDRSIELGLDPLVDQQLAGLIMWVPACIPYLLAGLAMTAYRLNRSSERNAWSAVAARPRRRKQV